VSKKGFLDPRERFKEAFPLLSFEFLPIYAPSLTPIARHCKGRSFHPGSAVWFESTLHWSPPPRSGIRANSGIVDQQPSPPGSGIRENSGMSTSGRRLLEFRHCRPTGLPELWETRRMPGRKRRLFGPLLYSTLAIAFVSSAYTWLVTVWPEIQKRERERVATHALFVSLHSTNPDERAAAATSMARMGRGVAVPHLLRALDDPRGEVRTAALRSLVDARAELRTVIPALARAAADSSQDLRLEASRGLARVAKSHGFSLSSRVAGESEKQLSSQTLAALRRMLTDTSETVRAAAADALAEFGPDPGAIAQLKTATHDKVRAVRLAATRTLLKVRGTADGSVVDSLLALVADPEPVDDRRTLMDLVARAGDDVQDRVVGALLELLVHGDPFIHLEVVTCLAAAGPRARGASTTLMNLTQNRDAFPTLRSEAGKALESIDGPRSPRTLAAWVGMVADPTLPLSFREAALSRVLEAQPSALAKATPSLVRQLGDEKLTIRTNALQLLGPIIDVVPAEIADTSEQD
jgi:HEAT repeat protein